MVNLKSIVEKEYNNKIFLPHTPILNYESFIKFLLDNNLGVQYTNKSLYILETKDMYKNVKYNI